jgi:hypothetical protein
MEAFVVFKYLHIVAMFFAVALAISGELVLRRVAQTADPHVIRTTIERVKPLAGTGSGILFVAGVVFGIIAALAGQMDLLRPWLVGAYLGVAAAFAIGATVTDPWVARLERASADGVATAELQAVIDDPRARVATWALMGLIALLVLLMVVKPLG